MLESTNRYATASREYLGRAWQYLAEEDLSQASEKGWGAAAEMVKAIAEERGWPHDGQRLLYRVIDNLVAETGDEELQDSVRPAHQLLRKLVFDGLSSVVHSERSDPAGQAGAVVGCQVAIPL